MQKWEALLEAERLRLSAPEVVYDHLSKLQRPPDRISENLPDEILDTLIAMNHPLVDIGLARFASNWEKLMPLWNRGFAVRLALLSNQNAGCVPPKGEFEKIIAHGSDEELEALLTNPSLRPNSLAYVISKPFGVDETKWQRATEFVLRNDRLTHTHSSDTWNEFTDAMEHERPIKQAWHLYETVEPTEAWAHILQAMSRLSFEVDLPESYLPDLSTLEGKEEWLKTAVQRNLRYKADLIRIVEEKWKTPPSDKDEHLSAFYWARAAFAKAVARKEFDLGRSFRDHPDQAFRYGFYAGTTVCPDWPVQEFADRDGMDFIQAIIENPTLYERQNYRLQKQVYRLAFDRKHTDDMRQGWFKRRLTELVAKDPSKYGDAPTPDQEAAERKIEDETAQREEMQRQNAEDAREIAERTAQPKESKFGLILAYSALALAMVVGWWMFR